MLCKHVKIILGILFFSFFFVSLSAEEKAVNLFTPGLPSFSAQWGLSLPARRDMRNPGPSEELIFAADFRELRLNSGIKYQANQLDITNRFIYMPTFLNAFQAGFGFYWHYYRYCNEFTENDLIVNLRFRWIKGPVFSLENASGFLFKFASIDAIRAIKPLIYNFSYNFELSANWHIFNRADLWCALVLQDYFDYALAISPFYKFGFDFAANKNIILGIDYTAKFIDMFYSAVYMNESLLRFTFKVVL